MLLMARLYFIKIGTISYNIKKNVIFMQDKIRGQRGRLQVQALGCVNSWNPLKLVLAISLERKSVFRDVRIKAKLDLIFGANAIKWRTEWRLVLSMKMTS